MFREKGLLDIHFASPFYSGDQLSKTLYSMRDGLLKQGISAPDPRVYRDLFTRKSLGEDGGVFMPVEEKKLRMHLGSSYPRMILSFDTLQGNPMSMFEGGVIYKDMLSSLDWLQATFPEKEIRLHFSASNPGATMISLLSSRFGMHVDPRPYAQMRPLWCELMERVSLAYPETQISLWASEDTPVTWPRVLQKVLMHEESVVASGSFDVMYKILDLIGRKLAIDSFMAKKLTGSTSLMMAMNEFLSTYVREDQILFEAELEGWDQEIVDDFELIYRQDLDACLEIEGLTLITLDTVLEEGVEQDVRKETALLA